MICGCGSASVTNDDLRDEAIAKMERALKEADPALIDEVVDFDALRGDFRKHYLEAAEQDPVLANQIKDPVKRAEMIAALDRMLETINPDAVATQLSKSQENAAIRAKGFLPIHEGWTIKPIDDVSFIAQHADPSGVVGFLFELRGEHYELIEFVPPNNDWDSMMK